MRRGTILVVEDTLSSLKLLSDTLSGEGYRVLPADSGDLALTALQSHQPELILLDIRMPGMDGFELIRRVKARDETRDIPVIFLSAADEVEARVEGFRLGAIDFIPKPFQREELLARVSTHLELAQLRARLQRQAAELQAANQELQAMRLSDQQQAAARQRALEKRYLDIVNTTDGIVWEADASTFVFTFVSDKAERLLGFPAADWLTPGFWVEHLHPDDRYWAPEYCAACAGRHEAHDFEYRFIARDGRTVWLRDIVTVVVEDNRPRWLRGVMIDITERKAMESKLRQAFLLLDEAQRLAKLGGWHYDCATAKITWTDEVYRIHGVSRDFDPSDAGRCIDFYFQEDIPTLKRAFESALNAGVPYDLELRMRQAHLGADHGQAVTRKRQGDQPHRHHHRRQRTQGRRRRDQGPRLLRHPDRPAQSPPAFRPLAYGAGRMPAGATSRRPAFH